MHQARWSTSLALALLLLLAPAAGDGARAQTRTLIPVPYNKTAPVEVSVSVDRHELRIGETVAICFKASRAGFVTLWNVSAEEKVARIFPNAFQPASAEAMAVEGGREYCAGKEGDPFRFQVGGPPGLDDLYLLWATDPALHPAPAAFAEAGAFAAALGTLNGTARDRWATAKTSFDIVPASGPVPPMLAPPVSGAAVTPPQGSAWAPPGMVPPATVPPGASSAPGQGGASGSLWQPPAAPPPLPSPRPPAVAPPAVAPPAVAPPPPAARPPQVPRLVVLAMGSNVKPLTKTNQDAALFAGVLKEMFRLPDENVLVLKDVYKADFKRGMDWIRGRARPGDIAVIFYSGHGAQVRDPTRTSADGLDEAFVPYEFQTKAKPSGRDLIWSQEFARWVNAIPTDSVITVIDACHSAGLYRSIDTAMVGAKAKVFVPPSDMDMTPPVDLDEPTTRAMGGRGRVAAKGVLFAAARRDQSALEAQDGGVFVMTLLRAMVSAKGGTLADQFEAAADKVNRATKGKQTPQAVGAPVPARRLTFNRKN